MIQLQTGFRDLGHHGAVAFLEEGLVIELPGFVQEHAVVGLVSGVDAVLNNALAPKPLLRIPMKILVHVLFSSFFFVLSHLMEFFNAQHLHIFIINS